MKGIINLKHKDEGCERDASEAVQILERHRLLDDGVVRGDAAVKDEVDRRLLTLATNQTNLRGSGEPRRG